MKKLLASVPLFTLAMLALTACSSTSTPTNTGGTGATNVGGCTSFVDHTADAEVTLTWGFSITSQADHCSKIKVGSKVKWVGNFTTHPLLANGGDSGNPITSSGAAAGAAEITFPAAGKFGYICGVHTSMTGAIEVTP
jgi:plastocyanin